MTIEEVKDKVKCIIADEACSLQLYLLLKQNDDYVLRLADIEDASAMPGLRSLFAENLASTIVDNSELILRSLSADDPSENSLYLYDYDDIPDDLRAFANFDIHEAVHTEKFNFSGDDLSKLFGFIIYLGTMDSGVTLFKKHYPIALIKRDSFLLGVIKSKKRFEKVSGEDILRMNGTWQLLRTDDGPMLIQDLTVLEKNLGFTKMIEKAAQGTIEAIEAIEILESVEALSDELDNVTFARKLARISKSSAVFEKGISSETILRFSKETPALAGQFLYNEAGNRIILSTKKQKDAFLRLINDDFLHSELTTEYYAARSKDYLKKEQ